MDKQLFNKYADLIVNYASTRYMDMFREPAGNLQHKFIVPGSARYNNCLWAQGRLPLPVLSTFIPTADPIMISAIVQKKHSSRSAEVSWKTV